MFAAAGYLVAVAAMFTPHPFLIGAIIALAVSVMCQEAAENIADSRLRIAAAKAGKPLPPATGPQVTFARGASTKRRGPRQPTDHRKSKRSVGSGGLATLVSQERPHYPSWAVRPQQPASSCLFLTKVTRKVTLFTFVVGTKKPPDLALCLVRRSFNWCTPRDLNPKPSD